MKSSKEDQIVGIDGCPGGWFSIAFEGGTWQGNIFKRIDDLVIAYPDGRRYLIDIPIGLSSTNFSRKIDQVVRNNLSPKRKSSVFTPPCREALSANSYEAANAINSRITGKGISKQTWNISSKIREMDEFLRGNEVYRESFYEAHPELCFEGLNGGSTLKNKKAAPKEAGIEERMMVLKNLPIDLREPFSWVYDRYPKTLVRPDDILDALCLCVTGIMGNRNGFAMIHDEELWDSEEIPLRLIYFKHN